MGASFSGRTAVSKTANVGSIPTAPAFASLKLGFGGAKPARRAKAGSLAEVLLRRTKAGFGSASAR